MCNKKITIKLANNMTTFNFRSAKNDVVIRIKAENENKANQVLKNMLTEVGISEVKTEQFELEK